VRPALIDEEVDLLLPFARLAAAVKSRCVAGGANPTVELALTVRDQRRTW